MSLETRIRYVFIPGKNWKLSLAELVSFLKARDCFFEVSEFTPAFFVFSVGKSLDPSIIDELVGFIKIARVTSDIAGDTVREAFVRGNKEAKSQVRTGLLSGGLIDEMLVSSSGKLVFGVSVYDGDGSLRRVARAAQRFLGSSLKDELAINGRKSRFMGFPRGRAEPQLSHVEVLKKNLVEQKGEILFCSGKEHASISVTVGVHDPFEFQKRDVGRPVQRKIFAIPPRLARIMINQAFCTRGKSLLDPFCGVGTILQEALLAKARVVGLDVDPWCVKASKANLEWLKKEYALKEAEYAVLQGDSRRLTDRIKQEIDCIATEPDLGPALRHIPTEAYALKITENLKPLYIQFMEEAYKVLKKRGRLVLVTPYIRTRSGKLIAMPLERKATDIGFAIVCPLREAVFAREDEAEKDLARTASFVDIGERHKIGREIHVFEK